jgi:Holliday junction resolvasome RuvABC ATP-dependent DNA helicase subunit
MWGTKLEDFSKEPDSITKERKLMTYPNILVIYKDQEKGGFTSYNSDPKHGINKRHTNKDGVCNCPGYVAAKTCTHIKALNKTVNAVLSLNMTAPASIGDKVIIEMGKVEVGASVRHELDEGGIVVILKTVEDKDHVICRVTTAILDNCLPTNFMGDKFGIGSSLLITRSPSADRNVAIKHFISNFEAFLNKSTSGETSAPTVDHPWFKIKVPSDFKIDPIKLNVMACRALQGRNLTLVGPKGCGKSEFAGVLAKSIGYKLESFNMGATSEPRSTLIGNTHKNQDGTFFRKSRFISAIQSPKTIILLDEMSRAGPDAYNILLPLLDDQGYMALDESEEAEVVKKHPETCFISTANIGAEYTGTMALDAALLDRSMVIEFDYPSQKDEEDLICERKKISRRIAQALAKVAATQRAKVKENELTIPISTRMLLETADLIKCGFKWEVACTYGILSAFSSNGGTESERASVGTLIQAMGDIK